MKFENEQKIMGITKISLTAFCDESTMSDILKAGADFVFNKPLSDEDASKIYNDILSKY